MDVLRWPVLGRGLRWRHARTSLQLVLLLVAAAIVVHGLAGPQLGSGNLATVLTWVHYRGLLVVALLAAGNLFCTGCPIVRVRDWGRILHAPRWNWPARLRGKWAALVLFALVLFSYELFDLWALPSATAILVLAYFGAALLVDTLFRGASFCKHLCPIGQFNFMASTVSPLEVQVREAATCESCRTADCVNGRWSATVPLKLEQRGCELGLFLPAKVGNLDCTFCLDCVQACPHDNVALASRVPAVELADDGRRSAIGRLIDRPDLAALAVLFVFGALLNAVAMTTAGGAFASFLASGLGTASAPVVLGIMFVIGLGIVPVVLLTAAAAATRVLTADHSRRIGAVFQRYVFSLVPLGVCLWMAHYGFHLLTGVLVVVPVTQAAVVDLVGWPLLGEPLWRWTGMRPGDVFPLQLGMVVLGAFGSLAVTYLISERDYPARSGRAAISWACLIVFLALTAAWILFQPMEMRGVTIG